MSIDSRVLNFGILVFIAVCTFFFIPINPAKFQPEALSEIHLMNQELFFRYGAFALFGISFFVKPKRQLVSTILGIFILYVFFSALNIGFNLVLRRSILNVFIGLLFYRTIYENLELKNLKPVGWMATTLIGANLLFSGLQFFHMDPLFTHVHPDVIQYPDPCGLMNLPAHLGSLAVILNPLLFIISPWLTLLCLPLIYFSMSSASALAYLISTLFILYFSVSKRIFFLITGVFILSCIGYSVFYDFPTGNFAARLPIWKETFSKVAVGNLYLGFGLGSFAEWAPRIKESGGNMQVWVWAHNEYLQTMFETGLIGLFMVLFYLRDLWIKFLKNKQVLVMASVIALAVVSFFHFPFHIARLACVSIFVLALCHAKLENQ